MSYTVNSTTLRLKKTPSDITPHKRQRKSEIVTVPSTKDIWTWTLTSDAVAPCYVRDVFEMKENPEDYDFYWLGRIPCRNVRLVGLVIGVSVYPKKITYSIDDGTSVIDCTHNQTPRPLSPKNRIQTAARSGRTVEKPDLLPMPIPKAEIGDFVQVMGRVQTRYEDRQVIVTELSRSSPNGELDHCRLVRGLHKTSYSLAGPFTLPTFISKSSPQKESGSRAAEYLEPEKLPFSPSPAPQSSPPLTVASSPAKSDVAQLSPRKLRHPSRLRSKDLTANTFRIYMKHYMDNLPDLQVESLSDCESDIQIGRSLAQTPASPTKRSRYDSAITANTEDLVTPRPVVKQVVEHTPRPRIPPLTFTDVNVTSTVAASNVSSSLPIAGLGRPPPTTNAATATTPLRGFTLSYLRRVPELSLLARKVTEAEAKRRAHEEKKKAKEAAGSGPSSRATSSKSAPIIPIPEDKLAGKMKRLFQWAIRALHKEGSIVLWDGPVRPCPSSSAGDTSRLWKANNSAMSSMAADSTLFSSSSLAGLTQLEDGDVYLSDPQDGEESYSPVTPGYLGEHVEKAMRGIRSTGHCQITIERILRALKKDDRWRNLGSWSVGDTLEMMCKHGKLRESGDGRWDLVC